MPDRNQWFVYDNQKDIDDLLAALHPRGVRETALADNIRQLYPELTRLMKAAGGASMSTADAAVPIAAAAVACTAAAVGAMPENVVQVTQVTRYVLLLLRPCADQVVVMPRSLTASE